MRPLFLILLAVTCSLATFAQKIEKYYDFAWRETTPANARFLGLIEKTDSGWHRKDYFIREKSLQMVGTYDDSACKIPNGEFRYYHANGGLSRSCRYIHGKLEGLWLSYHSNGMINDSTSFSNGHKTGVSLGWHENGFLSDSCFWTDDGSGVGVGWFNNGNPSYAGRYVPKGKKEGKWMFYHRNGKPSAVEMYKEGKLIDKQYFDEQGNVTDTINKDRKASFPGGAKAWKKYLLKKLTFPSGYTFVNGDQAIVVVNAIIDEEGNVTEVAVSSPFHPAFDAIALDVIRNSPKWEPAIQHNRKLRQVIKQPVAFMQK